MTREQTATIRPPGLSGRARRLADLAVEVPLLHERELVPVADRLFLADPTLSGIVVLTTTGPRLLPRSHLTWMLSGRFGYGRALHMRSDLRAVLPPGEPPVTGDLPISAAARHVLDRPLAHRYDDLLVDTQDGPQLVSVAILLEQVSLMFRHTAFHDPLTGLANRLFLEEHGQALQSIPRVNDVAVCYVDLDGFKAVNDTYGHRAGDEVLEMFGRRLLEAMRPGDLVARLGGDEFAVVVEDVDNASASAIAERIVLLAGAPFVIDDGHILHLSASVGIAMLSHAAAETELTRLDVLLRDSDTAMLMAKRSGKNQVYGPAVPESAISAVPARNAMVRRRLQHALTQGAFELHYQPRFDLATGAIESVEALLRWTDAHLGAVSPAEFIPVAEESGQILRLGAWVLRQACAQWCEWSRAGEGRPIAVNVSLIQLRSPLFADEVLATIAEFGVPPAHLRIEVTETSVITDLPRAIKHLFRLRDAGVAVDLDDFGTGYSSLAMLRDLPLSSVKIDKHFVDRLETSAADEYLVRGVIETAHALGLSVTAEGVERPSQLRRLRALGCDSVQGFLTGRPVPAAAIGSVAQILPRRTRTRLGAERPTVEGVMNTRPAVAAAE